MLPTPGRLFSSFSGRSTHSLSFIIEIVTAIPGDVFFKLEGEDFYHYYYYAHMLNKPVHSSNDIC